MVFKSTRTDKKETTKSTDLLQEIKIDHVEIDMCNLNPYSSSVIRLRDFMNGIIKVNSSSKSNVLFGEIVYHSKVLPVSIKIFSDVKHNESIKYEANMYKYITDEIIEKSYSPNFASFVGFGCCNYDSIKNLVEKHDTNINTVQHNIDLCLLMTEKVGNGAQFGLPNKNNDVKSLRDYLKMFRKGKIDQNDFRKIMFQIIYSLEVMERLKIIHADVHSHNILVCDFETEISLCYVIDKVSYSIKTRYVPYIFDWDFSYTEKLGINSNLDNFTIDFFPYVDIYRLFNDMRMHKVNIDFIQDYTNNQIIMDKELSNVEPLSEKSYKYIYNKESYFSNTKGIDYEWVLSEKEIQRLNSEGRYIISSFMANEPISIGYITTVKNVGHSVIFSVPEYVHTITKEQKNKLYSIHKSNYGGFISDTYPLWLMTGKELQKVVPNFYQEIYPTTIKKIMFTIITVENDNGNQDIIYLFNPHPGVITSTDDTLLTPLEVINKYFSGFIKERDDCDIDFLYALPENV